MASTVRERLLKGFAAQGFAQVVNLVIQIGSVPLFLHFWGKFLYGEWILLSTVPSYFALSDLGFANAAGTEMTLRMGRGDQAGALKVFQCAWVLVTGVSLAVVGAMLIGVRFLPLSQWLHITSLSHQEVVTVVSILVFQVFFDLQTGLIGNGYRCDGNFAIGTMVRNLQRLAEFVVGAVALCLGAHLAVLALCVMLTRLLGNLLSFLDVRRRSPWLVLGWRHADRATLKLITSPALTFMGFPLGHALSLQGMVTVVGMTLGPGVVVLFSTSRTLTRFVWQLLNAITNTVWVELSTAFGADDIALARRLHRRACQAALWIALVCSVALFFAGPLIFPLWTHDKSVVFNPSLFGLLLVVGLCNSLWSTSYVVLISVNRHQRLAAVYVAATALSMALGYVLIPLLGLPGAALSLLVIDVFMSFYVVSRSLELVQDHLGDFLKAVLMPPFLKPPFSKPPTGGTVVEPV
jgi:O-antigen/teichoic acid export membrane protein